MEVDPEQPQLPQFITYFDVSNAFPWRETRPEQIEQRRALLGDVLIFDLLLSSGGVKHPDAIYPPIDVPALHRLLDAIEASHYDALKKECLVYYLLKWHSDGREERFQVDRCIPPHFAALADAYWFLDTGANVPLAVSILSDARINQDYASKVLQAICLVSNPSPLVVKYVRTAQPALTEPHDLEVYALSLAEASSFIDAWGYQRVFNESSPMRSKLLKKLLEWTVTPKPKSLALKQLLFLPLSRYEELLLKSYAQDLTLPPSAMTVLQDLVCVRLIQAGQYLEAIKIDHEFTASTSGKLKGLTAERSKMIQELYSTLPQTERLLLDGELKTTNQHPSSSENMATSKVGGDISMSSSWEDVRLPRSPSPTRGAFANLKAINRDPQPSLKSLVDRPQAPRLSGSLLQKPLVNPQAPLLTTSPANTPQPAAKPVARKSFPLPLVPPVNPAANTSARPRYSAGHGSTNPTLDGPKAFSSAFTSKRPSPERYPSWTIGTSTHVPAFSSANRSKNAFYEPPAKANGVVSHALTESKMAEVDDVLPDEQDNEDIDMEKEDAGDGHEEQDDKDEDTAELHYSIFENNGSPRRSRKTSSNGAYALSPEQSKKRQAVPPGAFLSDEEDLEEDEQEAESWEKATAPSASSPRYPSSESASKPDHSPAKKKRQSVVRELEQLKRSLPGSLIDDEEDEEEEHIAPLPSPTRRPLRKNWSTSSDPRDEPEGPQTRRRSSRLSSQVNVTTSPEASPKKSSAHTRTRKSTKPTTSTKKKR